MGSSDKRYFKKRENSSLGAEEKQLDEPLFESGNKQFPHIFRFITARLLWGVFITILYSGVMFVVLVQLPVLYPRPSRLTSFSDDLTTAPLSYRSHLLYLESLTVKNRLEEAQHESDFLKIAKASLHPTAEELSALLHLQNSISARKMVFHTTIDEYNHWNEVIKSHPDFRDALYIVGQKSYMLFDDAQSREYVQKSVNLDPQFDQGKRVLQRLGE